MATNSKLQDLEPQAAGGASDHGPLARLAPSWVEPRARLWFWAGLAIVSFVVLKDLSTLLGQVQSAGARSYNAGAFTGFHLKFWDVDDLAAAIDVWRRVEADEGLPVLRLLRWHLLVDALAFIPAYCILLYKLLSGVDVNDSMAKRLVWAILIVDEIETLISYVVLVWFELEMTNALALGTMQFFSAAKWLLLIVAAVTAFFLWRSPAVPGRMRYQKVSDALGHSRRGRAQGPANALLGLILLVGFFALLIGLPAGGPLDQIPDVIRYQLGEHLGVWFASFIGLMLFAFGLLVAGLLSTDPNNHEVDPVEDSLPTWAVGVAAVLWAVILEIIVLLIQGTWSVIPAVAPGLVLVLFAISKIVESAREARRAGEPPHETGKELPPPPHLMTEQERAVWIGGLVGVILLAASVGMVRAAYPPALLLEAERRWWFWVVLGLLGASVGGWLAQFVVVFLCGRLGARTGGKPLLFVGGVFSLILVIFCGWLIASPESAFRLGSTGIVATSLALYSLIVGVLKWVSRRWAAWQVTRQLGFGNRTSWVSLLLLTVLVASILNTKGGYHDARVSSAFGPSSHRYPDLETAFATWTEAQQSCPAPDGEPVPLVLVAAPGGGIRAAYWTASALQEIFGSDGSACSSQRLFAVSGVSGGSVGTTAWVASSARNAASAAVRQTPREMVERLSEDKALASTMVGMLLRDSFQPLLGLSKPGLDRAALLENGWERSAEVFRDDDGGSVAWAELGNGMRWVPVLTLNGSSVRDGCRVLVSNVGSLPSARLPDCQLAPGDAAPPGPVSGAIDAFDRLSANVNLTSEDCPVAATEAGGTRFGMRATTAALLSARFTYVAPSGALRRCFGDEEMVTYDVDGGYYENSGLLTIVQIWEGLAPLVDAHNRGLSPPGEAAPSVPSQLGEQVEPWIVLLDNHYRSAAIGAPPKRPLELLVPLVTKSGTLSQTALEQVAANDMSREGNAAAAEPRYFRLAPSEEPGVAAPLGWVLSRQTLDNLTGELRCQVRTEVPEAFREAVGFPEPDASCK